MSQFRAKYPGRLRIKAAELLNGAGLDVTEFDVEPAQGYWRSSPNVDMCRFYVKTYTSWQTLTEFVRLGKKYGITIDEKQREIWANESKH